MSETRKAYLIMQFCTLLWGFTAILGKLIELPAIVLVWWRLLITTVILWLVPQLFKKARAIPKKILRQLMVVGGTGFVFMAQSSWRMPLWGWFVWLRQHFSLP
jgi:drug/metabolite transporter (DMT)-like permease